MSISDFSKTLWKLFSFSVENQQINSQWKSFQALIYTLSCSYKDRDSLPWILLSLERHSRCMCAKPLGVLRGDNLQDREKKTAPSEKAVNFRWGWKEVHDANLRYTGFPWRTPEWKMPLPG